MTYQTEKILVQVIVFQINLSYLHYGLCYINNSLQNALSWMSMTLYVQHFTQEYWSTAVFVFVIN